MTSEVLRIPSSIVSGAADRAVKKGLSASLRAAYPVTPLASFNPDVAHLLACFDELVEGAGDAPTPANWRSTLGYP